MIGGKVTIGQTPIVERDGHWIVRASITTKRGTSHGYYVYAVKGTHSQRVGQFWTEDGLERAQRHIDSRLQRHE